MDGNPGVQSPASPQLPGYRWHKPGTLSSQSQQTNGDEPLPYVEGKYVSRFTYEMTFPPRSVQLEAEEEAETAASPRVVRRGGETVAKPTNRSRSKQKAQSAAALAATGVKLPLGIQMPEDGKVPPVSQTDSGGVVPNDETLDEDDAVAALEELSDLDEEDK